MNRFRNSPEIMKYWNILKEMRRTEQIKLGDGLCGSLKTRLKGNSFYDNLQMTSFPIIEITENANFSKQIENMKFKHRRMFTEFYKEDNKPQKISLWMRIKEYILGIRK